MSTVPDSEPARPRYELIEVRVRGKTVFYVYDSHTRSAGASSPDDYVIRQTVRDLNAQEERAQVRRTTKPVPKRRRKKGVEP